MHYPATTVSTPCLAIALALPRPRPRLGVSSAQLAPPHILSYLKEAPHIHVGPPRSPCYHNGPTFAFHQRHAPRQAFVASPISGWRAQSPATTPSSTQTGIRPRAVRTQVRSRERGHRGDWGQPPSNTDVFHQRKKKGWALVAAPQPAIPTWGQWR
jgi:hypothetical protein